MKKLLLTTVLASSGMPAMAGPLLDDFTGGAEYTAGSERILDGVEVYKDITLKDLKFSKLTVEDHEAKRSLIFEGLEADNGEGTIVTDAKRSLIFEGLQADNGAGTIVTSDRGSMTYDYVEGQAFEAQIETFLDNLKALEDWSGSDACSAASMPLSLHAENLHIKDEKMPDMAFSEASFAWTLYDPEGDCKLFQTAKAKGIALTDPSGASIEIANAYLTTALPLKADHLFDEQGHNYLGSLHASDITVSAQGVPQVEIEHVALGALFGARANAVKEDQTGKAPSMYWDAIRAIKSHGNISISGMEIVGDLPQALTGEEALSKGRTLNGSIDLLKESEDVGLEIHLAASEMVDLGASLSLELGEMDASVSTADLNAVLMSAPINVAGFDLAFSDKGVGTLIAEKAGMDIYTFIPMMAGPENADNASAWLEAAKSGTATLSAHPDASVPMKDILGSVMGNWSALATLLDIKSNL